MDMAAWKEADDMSQIVDELFVEMHYEHASLKGVYNWKSNHTREDAHALLEQLRYKGFFVHAWP